MAQYLKPDTELGYIEDQAEIENLKFNNLRHTILGCMLGDFDETGAYVVEPEIVKELIELPKYIVETLDNIEICKGILKLDKQISFMVTFEGNKATLTLIEKLSYEANYALNSGAYSNINEYVLDSVETSGEINRNVIYARWNIDTKPGNVIDIFNCDEEVLEKYFGIVNRFKYLLHANRVLIEKEETIEEIEAEYTNAVFEILKHYPKLNDAVIKQVKETLTEKKDLISVKKPFFVKTLNEVLENAIQSNVSQLDEKEKEEFQKEKQNATTVMNIKKAEVLETENVKVDEQAELSPNVNRIRTEQGFFSQDVVNLGNDFVAACKENETQETFGDQKIRVIKTLNGFGLNVAVVEEANAEQTKPANLVAGATERVAGNAKTQNNVKKGGQNNASAGRRAGNAQGKGGKKSQGTARKKPAQQIAQDKSQQQGEQPQTNKTKTNKKTRRVVLGFGTTRPEPTGQQGEIIAKLISAEELLKQEQDALSGDVYGVEATSFETGDMLDAGL